MSTLALPRAHGTPLATFDLRGTRSGLPAKRKMIIFAVFLYLLPCIAVLMVLLFLCVATRMANEPSLSDPRAYETKNSDEKPEPSLEESSVVRVMRHHPSVKQDQGME